MPATILPFPPRKRARPPMATRRRSPGVVWLLARLGTLLIAAAWCWALIVLALSL